MVREIRAVLAERFGVRRVRAAHPRLKSAYDASGGGRPLPPRWGELHADYYESGRFAWSAVLFLGEEETDPVPLRGGELGMADLLEATPEGARLLAGSVVEPRRGRLVLFSGSGENYHAPLPVTQGRRTSFQVWFECDCMPSSLTTVEA